MRSKAKTNLSIPATIKVKEDSGKVRVFRRKELVALVSIPSKMSDKHREADQMPGVLGYWNYYAEVYRARMERIQREHDVFASRVKRGIELMIRRGEGMSDKEKREKRDRWGDEWMSEHNLNASFYTMPEVQEAWEKLCAARRKYNVIKLVADVLSKKLWVLNSRFQQRGQY